MGLVASVVFGGAIALGPDLWINRKVDDRQKGILRSLPDVLDLLTISVEAGLGFEQALDRVIGSVPGPLSDEFARARRVPLRCVPRRRDASHGRALQHPRAAVVRAGHRAGRPVRCVDGRVLRAQSEEMRIKRRQLAQEKAQKAPVKC